MKEQGECTVQKKIDTKNTTTHQQNCYLSKIVNAND